MGVDINRSEVENNIYKSWCVPFDKGRYRNLSAPKTVAISEHILEAPKVYGLPPINPRWPQIMDDEIWYVYSYDQDGTEEKQDIEIVDRYES